MLIDLKWAGHLSATQVCKLCFWLSKAGVGGLIKDLAVHPERGSSQYSKDFDLCAGTRRIDTDGDLYCLQSPSYLRSEARRCVQDLLVWTPLEAAEEEVRTTLGIHEKLAKSIDSGELPQAYFDHPVKQRAPPGSSVFPWVLYIDGVKFQRTDGLLRFSLCSLITGISHLNVVLRKSELCACGCRGWCTIFGVMLMLSWSFEALASGRWFESRHDGAAWRPDDHNREAKVGTLLGFFGLLLFSKQDMAEFISTFGFPSWKTIEHPCALCFCTRHNWGAIAGLSPLSLPWPEKTIVDYCTACDKCEHWVVVKSMALLMRIRAALSYDKRKQGGSRGKALRLNIPELNLLAGDRVEPHPKMPDVGAIDACTSVLLQGLELLFWRQSSVTLTQHRNPLFNAALGITPEDVLVPDWLHTLSLGVYKRIIAFVWHKLFAYNIFDVDESQRSVHHVFIEACVHRLRERLLMVHDRSVCWPQSCKSAGSYNEYGG
jgi:hypothetical protein